MCSKYSSFFFLIYTLNMSFPSLLFIYRVYRTDSTFFMEENFSNFDIIKFIRFFALFFMFLGFVSKIFPHVKLLRYSTFFSIFSIVSPFTFRSLCHIVSVWLYFSEFKEPILPSKLTNSVVSYKFVMSSPT